MNPINDLMGLDPSLREQEQIADAHERYVETLSPAERRAEWVVGGSFVLALAVLLALFPPASGPWYPPSAACCLLVLVVALRAQFETGSGFTVPVQIAFVPLLFMLPPVLAPAVVVLALVIGKVAIPKEIIDKPGKLDLAEWQIVKTHTLEGQRMLDQVGGFMSEVGKIVRLHHERWDGDGYPDGLAGDDIPLEARTISACDTWNAMTTTRPYRAALTTDVAERELRRCSGTRFDPVVVEQVLHAIAPSRAAAQPVAIAVAAPVPVPRLTRKHAF